MRQATLLFVSALALPLDAYCSRSEIIHETMHEVIHETVSKKYVERPITIVPCAFAEKYI